MTARNRLRKRLAQKAKVSTSSQPNKNLQSSAANKNLAANCNNDAAGAAKCPTMSDGKEKTVNTASNQLAATNCTTQTPSLKTAADLQTNICKHSLKGNSEKLKLTSTAATIDPKNNQIQTVVVDNPNMEQISLNTNTQSSCGQGI